MNMTKRILVSAICCVPLGLAGCAEDHHHEHVRREQVVVVEDAPPPVRREVIPVAPSREHIWVDGHWVRRGHGWEWEPGYYVVRPRPRAEWEPGHWAHDRGGYVYVDGHWR